MNLPNRVLGVVNVLTGSFSTFSGIQKISSSTESHELFDTANPWLYVVGGITTAVIGAGNFLQSKVALYASAAMTLASLYNAWFGAARQDWRFWTLNSYCLITCVLIALAIRGSRDQAKS